MEFKSRLDKIQEKMEKNDIDYVILTPGSNLEYLSGVDVELDEREFFFVVPKNSEPFFFLNELMEEEIREESTVEEFKIWKDSENPKKRLREAVDPVASKILIEDSMPARFTLQLREIFDEAEFGLASNVLENLRIQKTEEEIRKLQETAELADKVIKEVRNRKGEFIGKTESELADFIEHELKDNGGEELSFDVIASSGSNGAKPHYRHGDVVIEEGTPVVLDFGCFKDFYPSDQTRTLILDGEPSEKFKEVHDTVRRAQQKAVEKVEPGVKAKEVDRAARKVIEESGYGEGFIHRTGHGVGLSVHEPPFINQENDRELEEGMVFSVEPGIYIEGEFGVRIEDLVVVTEDGFERLNKTERGWN